MIQEKCYTEIMTEKDHSVAEADCSQAGGYLPILLIPGSWFEELFDQRK